MSAGEPGQQRKQGPQQRLIHEADSPLDLDSGARGPKTGTILHRFFFSERFDHAREFENFEVFGAGGPVVAPANDQVATFGRMAVFAEIPALEFKFDEDVLPFFLSDSPLGFAVGKSRLDVFHDVAEVFGEHAEEHDDALLVGGFMAEQREEGGMAIGWAVFALGVQSFERGSGGGGVIV